MTKELSSYYTYLNTNLLQHLPEKLGLVLDIGCGGGELGAAYKKANTACIWHGIDIHQEAIKHAKKNLDSAWVVDANTFKMNATMTKKKYDALIYSLSLEQLANPVDALIKHMKLLKKGGQLFFCFPNIQHWSLIRHVISGNWEPSDRGILQQDNQHFFTRKSFIKMVDSIDLKVTAMHRYSYESDPLFRRRRGARLKTMEKLKAFCKDTNLYFNENDFRTYHFIMTTERK